MSPITGSRRRASIYGRIVLGFLALVSFPAETHPQTFEVLYNLGLGPIGPQGPLIQAADGSFYGTTSNGGIEGLGTVYRVDPSGSLTTLHSFSGLDGSGPFAGLIQATDGNLYGTTTAGGGAGYGTVFRIDMLGNWTTLHSFVSGGSEGKFPFAGVLQAADGNLYGTTSLGGAGGFGTVFRMDLAGNVTVLHSFTGGDGASPEAALIQASDGAFYGTTFQGGSGGCPSGCGTVFRIDSSGNLTALHGFTGSGSEGASPWGALIQASDGNFYGTTTAGGPGGFGTVFRVDSAGNLTTLYDFSGVDGAVPFSTLIQATDGFLYGTTDDGGSGGCGAVFRMDLAGNLTTLYSFVEGGPEGEYPTAGVIQASDGSFYGTATAGGAGGEGTVFRMDSSGNVTPFHTFVGTSAVGAIPVSGLIQGSDGALYGTTAAGGTGGLGTVFKIDTSGNWTTLHSFTGAGSEGSSPHSGLVQASDGNFYGTTVTGGAGGYGTIFRIDPAGHIATIHSFDSSNGAYPWAGLLQAADGSLYGTTPGGGASGSGTVFRVDFAGNEIVLHSFSGAGGEGASPYGGLIQAADGNFYGVTQLGGANNEGTAFEIDGAGNLTTLHSFISPEGLQPWSAMMQGSDGSFYGTTPIGGSNGFGAVFRMDSSHNVATLYSFTNGSDGVDPFAGLIEGSDGNLYGATSNTLFAIDFAGSLTMLHSFAAGGAEGVSPLAALLQPADGDFYGTTQEGGAFGGGVIFRLGLCLPPVASSNSPICSGQTLQLSAYPSAGAVYSWTGPGGFTSALQAPAIPNATAANAGTYAVTVAEGICAPVQATVGVAVNAGLPPAPVITSALCVAADTAGLSASVAAVAGDTYTWNLFGGTIDAGQGTNSISFTSGGPGMLLRLTVVESNTSCAGSDSRSIQADYADVPASNPFHDFICTLARDGVTAGCGGGNFCPASSVLRSQMAVFLLRGEHGSTYTPPPATGIFGDVSASNPFAPWIERLYAEGITGGCSTNPLLYCPTNSVTRASMAVFLLAAQHGTGYVPPACAGIFTDVACPGAFTDWIEQLYNEGVTGGCSTNPLQYCPGNSVTRAQMAVFLTATFNLP